MKNEEISDGKNKWTNKPLPLGRRGPPLNANAQKMQELKLENVQLKNQLAELSGKFDAVLAQLGIQVLPQAAAVQPPPAPPVEENQDAGGIAPDQGPKKDKKAK